MRRRANKVVDLPSLLAARAAWRQAGRTVVWTNGCFDLLHAGHVRSLEAASELGDVLVVGVNSDESVRRLKGAGRPVLCAADRAEVVLEEAASAVVLEVVSRDQDLNRTSQKRRRYI